MENIFNFNLKKYIISAHAKKRLIERANILGKDAKDKCLELILAGELLLETDVFRYIRNGNLFFPCKNEGDNTYTVTTVLLYDEMVENRFQNIVDMYN